MEQKCPYPDIDNKDQKALHILRKKKDYLEAYARLLFCKPEEIKIGRIVTPLEIRGKGIGKAFIKDIITYIKINYPGKDIYIDAQSRLEQFYQKLGFQTIGPEFFFEDDPIPHVPMKIFSK